MSSVGSEAGSEESNTSRSGDIVKTGYMKKLKTMKKKFFVLRADSANFPACLEYYDSGKKWKNKLPPKRRIALKTCFNLNRRMDTKYKYVIALYSGIECFGIVFECEDDLQEWLRLLLSYQLGVDGSDSVPLKPYYEYVWKVTIQKKELACKHNLSGIYLVCLSDSTLSLVKPAMEEEHETKFYDFSLQSIRRCGNLDSFFYMELGQASCIGAGNLWMQAEDSNCAQHMHSVIMNAFTNCPKKELVPKCRSRSSSANEASKPMYFGRKWPSSGDDSLSVLSYSKSQSHQEHSITSPNSVGHSVSSTGDGFHHCNHNLTSVSFSPYPPTRRASTGTRPVTTGPALSSGRTNTSYTGRERCDSLPTRPRLTLDALSSVRAANIAAYTASMSGRPCSMYNRSIFSPTHPTSPISATYSTDSAGSSLSVDADSENWSEMETSRKIIVEENAEDYVQWGGNQNQNFLSENIPQSSNAVCRNVKTVCQNSSSNSHSSCSPCSSSPMDAGAYIPMSPIESVVESRVRQPLNRSYDSMNHSRESSIHEEVGEGYVPMAPLSLDAGYMSMDHSIRKPDDLSPGISNCSITSGTPSTDCRFSEFHLDKVSSYLTPSDDDIIFNVRQTRAYSTGSKPDAAHNKFIRCDSTEGIRARAFSVGSKCSSNLPSTPRRTPNSTSTSSIEPCDDLMEMDFSANKLRRRALHSRLKQQASAVPHNSAEKLPHGATSHVTNNNNNNNNNDIYMDMSPKSSPKLELFNDSRISSDVNLSPPRLSKHLIGRSPPLNMNFAKQSYGKGSPHNSSGVLEKVVEAESQKSSADDSSYMDMKPGVCDVPDAMSKVIPLIATATNLHARKESFTILDPANMRIQTTCTTLPHIKQPLLETDGKQFKSPSSNGSSSMPVDGYMDMSFKGRRIETHSTNSMAKIAEKTPEGYVDMTFKKNSRKNLVDSNSFGRKPAESKTPQCGTGKENQMDARQCSKPIAIQQGKNKRSNSSSFFRRYKSEETQTSKPNFLPLALNIPTGFASLGRKKKGCQKKEKPTDCAVGLNSAAIFPLSPERAPSLNYDPNSKCAITPSGESVRLTGDYRSLERVDEMVNWDRKCSTETDAAESEVDENCDYIVMTPGVVSKLQRKVSEPICLKYSASTRTTNSREEIANEAKELPNKSLQRSTSVPSTMSGMRGWRRQPSPEFEKKNDVKCRSDSAVDCGQSVEVDTSGSCETPLNKVTNVPNTSTTCVTVLRDREKVMYATLDIPSSEQEISKKEENASSVKQSDQSNLMYAQIDFDKPSSSSSLSK